MRHIRIYTIFIYLYIITIEEDELHVRKNPVQFRWLAVLFPTTGLSHTLQFCVTQPIMCKYLAFSYPAGLPITRERLISAVCHGYQSNHTMSRERAISLLARDTHTHTQRCPHHYKAKQFVTTHFHGVYREPRRKRSILPA